MQIGSALTSVRKVYGDTAGDHITDSIALLWYDQAQKEFCSEVWPLYRWKGFSVSADQESFALPDENIIVDLAINWQGMTRILKYVPPRDFFTQQMAVPGAKGTPTIYTHFEGRIFVYPRYSTASKTTTTGAAVHISYSSITLASNSNLRNFGKVAINSEEIHYEKKGSVFISIARRGDGNTTAASHASNDTVTQLDLDLLIRRAPAALSATSSEPEIPEAYHEDLNNYVLYLAYMSEGQEQKANFFLNLFNQRVAKAKKTLQRKSLQEMAIRSINSQRVTGLYGPL